MAETGATIEERIDYKLATGQFLETLALIQASRSSEQHSDFIKNLKETAKTLRSIFSDEGLLHAATRLGNDFWKINRGKRIGFVDGGVASLDMPSSAPIGIRVGTYSVKIGDDGPDREQFDFKSFVVDELFGSGGRTFIQSFDDVTKMADASRMIAEISAATKLARDKFKPDLIMLHGPLVNPVAPYGTPGFPAFTKKLTKELFPFSKNTYENEDERHFVCLYRELIEFFEGSECPCLGVIERSATRRPQVALAHLDRIQKAGKLAKNDLNVIKDLFESYLMTDTMLFSIILNSNEWIAPITVDPQQPENKWPDKWKSEIRKYPAANTTYVKSSDESDPFRVQISENQVFETWMGDLLVNTAKLLPKYNFPVGLDIVDKHAKVPAWMSRGIKGQHAAALLMKALETGDPETISYAKRIMAAKGRDWMFRPKV